MRAAVPEITARPLLSVSGRTPVSIIIPAYNEEASVAAQVRRIQSVMEKHGWPYELIVVDDGSTDRTWEAIRHLDVRGVRLAKNRGYGAALKAGIAAAENELLAMIDADGTYPAEAIPQMLARANEYDMVVGARTSKNVHTSLWRQPARWLLRCVAGMLTGQHIPDLNSGLRVLRKAVVREFWHLLPAGFSFTTTITLAMLCNQYSVYYHPVDYYKRTGKSKIRPGHLWDFLLLILRTVVFFRPLRVFLPLGGILFSAGLAKLLTDLYRQSSSEVAALSILAAVIVWAVGLLADQIARLGVLSRSP
ncbi:MAG: glycosyltransferase family 2 protein [Firmicutes bacterium]|nr:glycosyltransferase family 2 protein [Bacillota bacterium]